MNVEIASRLVELRKKQGLSQEELAARLGISRQAVSKWERAESSPDTDNLIALAELYGVSLDDLLNMSPEDKGDATFASESRDPDDKSTTDDAEFFYDEKPEYVHVGPGGVHVKDGNDEVHVDWTGIHVSSAKDGEVHVDKNGVHVNDDHYSFDEAKEKFKVYCHDGHAHKKTWMRSFSYPILTVIVFLILGFCCNLWHPGWIIFLTIPVWYGIDHCYTHRTVKGKPTSWMKTFPFPILTIIAFLLLGFCGDLWHPGWIVFLTIPIWYGIANWHTHYIRERARKQAPNSTT